MRKTTRMAVLCILWAVSTCAAAEPKLVNEKRVFPKGDPMWKTPRQYNLWAMRLSPDGKHLLYPRTKGEPPLTPEGAPDFHKMQYEMVLRNLKTAKDTVLPTNPLKSGWRTVFTRFNMFDPAGKKLALANIVVEEQKVDERLTSVRTSMRVVLYDITTGKISKTNIKDPSCIAKFDRTGKGLIGIKGRRSLETFTSDSSGLKLKPLPIKGFLQSVCPTADVICVCAPPERGKPPGPGRRPERGPARLFLYDIKAGKEVGQLPMHQRNSKLDDWETQWTADGRYLYYYDVREVTEATVEGPRKKIRPITRVWDRLTGKQSGQVFDTVPIGPGPTATSMILAKRDNTGKYDRFLLHDAKTGADHPLGETGIRPIHAWGKKVLYAKKLPDGKEAAYVAEIEIVIAEPTPSTGSGPSTQPAGKAVEGQRISLSMVHSRLLYGQPISCIFRTAYYQHKPPYAYISLRGQQKNAVIELLDERGDNVKAEVIIRAHGTSSRGYTYRPLRLRPTGKHALGRYLRPGKYRLRISAKCKQTPGLGLGWTGTLVTNTIAFEVFPVKPGQVMPPVPPAARKTAGPLIRQLGAKDDARREAATKALAEMGWEILPMLEKAARADSPEASSRAKELIWRLLKPTVAVPPPEWRYQAGPFAGRLGEVSMAIIKKRVPRSYEDLLLARACFMSPGPYRDVSKLTKADVDKIVDLLAHGHAHESVLAMRGLSRTTDTKILTALIQCIGRDSGWGVRFYSLAHELTSAIRWQGAGAIDALLAQARRGPNGRVYGRVLRLLADAGPDKRTMQFLRERIKDTNAAPIADTVIALGAMGPQAAPLLLQIARNPKALRESRRRAIEALGKGGDAKTAGKFIIETLSAEKDEWLLREACEAAGRLKLSKAVGALVRISRDDKLATQPRLEAMWVLSRLAEKKRTKALMLELLDASKPGQVRARAIYVLAEMRSYDAVPKMLQLLEDDDLIVRRQADRSLRGLSRTAKGVGFELKTFSAKRRRMEADRWRKWWKEHPPGNDGAPCTRPTTQPNADRVRRLIAQLGNEDYRKRNKAQKELVKLGSAVVPALREALNHKDPEIAIRAHDAIKEIEPGPELGPGPDPGSKVGGRADQLVKLGEFRKACALYRKLLVAHPDSADLHIRVGKVLFRMRKLDEAITHFRRALKLDPTRDEVRKLLARAQKLRSAATQPATQPDGSS